MRERGASVRELMAENDALRRQLDSLMGQAEGNHAIMMRHQAFDLEIVGASTFPELIGTIFRLLPVVSSLDAVTLSLVDTGADIYTVMHRLGVDFEAFPDLLFHEDAETLGYDLTSSHAPTPRMMRFDPDTLNLGSCDPGRFTPPGTNFVEHMASIIAICLENVISNEMLKYIGLTDALTGVYNRRYIDRRLVEEIARARRQAYRISCMYIDIDHFKKVNDTHGHLAGDDVLREVARRIKAELRISDALGRFGGEEFVVLLIEADLASAGIVAERIRASVAGDPFLLPGGQALEVSVSIGVATLDDFECNNAVEGVATQLVAQADHALYLAKEGGRNRVVSSL